MTGRVRMKNGRLAKKNVIDKRKKAIFGYGPCKGEKEKHAKTVGTCIRGQSSS